MTFSGIEGMVELNGCAPRPIRVQGEPTSLQSRLSTQAPTGGRHSLLLGDRFSLCLPQGGARLRTKMQDRMGCGDPLRFRGHAN